MDDDTIIEIEGRQYVSPTKSRDEQLAFIDTLRDVTAENTAQINQNTYSLGSPVTSNIGGLGGSEALWQAQYQTPQVDATIADLRTTAQQTALNQELQNLQDMYQNRYKQARRAYSARAKAASNSGSGSGSGIEGDVDVDYGSDEKVNVGKLSEAAQKSLNTVASTNKNTTSGIMLWEGYRPNLSYAQNMFNYMSYLAQTRGQTDNSIMRNNSLVRGGV